MAKPTKPAQRQEITKITKKHLKELEALNGDTDDFQQLFEEMTIEISQVTKPLSNDEAAETVKQTIQKEVSFTHPVYRHCAQQIEDLADRLDEIGQEGRLLNAEEVRSGGWAVVEKLLTAPDEDWKDVSSQAKSRIFKSVFDDLIVREEVARGDPYIHFVTDSSKRTCRQIDVRKAVNNPDSALAVRIEGLADKHLGSDIYIDPNRCSKIVHMVVAKCGERIDYMPKKSRPYWSDLWSVYKWDGEIEECSSLDEIPYFRAFLDRLNDAEFFLAWLWAFYSEQPVDQMVWLYGLGDTGKSTNIDTLFDALFGRDVGYVAADSNTFKQDTFEVEKVVGAGMTCYADCQNRMLTFSSRFKSFVSGGKDILSVNPKHRTPYSAYYDGGLFVISNHLPFIDDRIDQTRRAVVLEIGPWRRPEDQKDREEVVQGVRSEVGRILYLARAAYAQRYDPKRSRITEMEPTLELKQQCCDSWNSDVRVYLEDRFEITGDVDDKVKQDEVYKWLDNECSADHQTKQKIRSFVRELPAKTTKPGNKPTHWLLGLRDIYHQASPEQAGSNIIPMKPGSIEKKGKGEGDNGGRII